MVLVRIYSKLDGEKSCRANEEGTGGDIAANTEAALGAVVDDGLLVKLRS